MVANSGNRAKQSSGIGLPRVPVSSSTAVTTPVESGNIEDDGQSENNSPPTKIRDRSQVDGESVDSRGSSPIFSDSDEQTDAAGAARTKSLRYINIKTLSNNAPNCQ